MKSPTRSVRADIWAKARALARVRGGDHPGAKLLSDRAIRFVRSLEGARLNFDDLQAAPFWAAWPTERVERLSRLAGVAANASTLRDTLDGEALRRVAEAVGEDALDAIVDEVGAGNGIVAPAMAHSVDEFGRIGMGMLFSQFTDRVSLTSWLQPIGVAAPIAHADPTAAAEFLATAQKIMSRLDGQP